jgi:Transmembrane protein 43
LLKRTERKKQPSNGKMSDQNGGGDFVEVTEHQGFGGRMRNSCGGLVGGPLLMMAAVVLLFWNEGRNIHKMKDFKESLAMVQSLSDTSTVDDSMNGVLVHVTGTAQPEENLYDETFGVYEDALKLWRNVETYQWIETSTKVTRKNTGGSTTTTTRYSYDKEWRSGLVDSSGFEDSSDHQNPDAVMFEYLALSANPIMLGAYQLSEYVTNRIYWVSQVSGLSVDNIPANSQAYGAVLKGDSFYFSDNPSSPAVGDTRVSFTMTPSGTISIIAKLTGDSFAPYATSRGGEVLLVQKGSVSAAAMIQQALDENSVITWALRGIGFALMFVGFQACFEPLVTFFDLIPFLGNVLEKGVIPCLALFVSSIISVSVIAIAWLFYRPLIGCLTLLVVGICFFFLARQAKKLKQENKMDGFQTSQQQEPHSFYIQPTYPSTSPPNATIHYSGTHELGEPVVYVPSQCNEQPNMVQGRIGNSTAGGDNFVKGFNPV